MCGSLVSILGLCIVDTSSGSRSEENILENYIGVKIIKAEPQEKDRRPGYKVRYPDGYVSWSPKETFERAYRKLDCVDFINTEM